MRADDGLPSDATTVTTPMSRYSAHPSAVIDEETSIGDGTRIWHFSHISRGAVIGEGCTIGQNVFVASNVRIGRGVKIQNNVSIYEGVELGDYVFCGPSCVFTNVWNPRAEIARRSEVRPTRVGRGATIGANATIVCGGSLGRYAFVAAGAVVGRADVPDYVLLRGVPARASGYMSRHGFPLGAPDARGVFTCPASGFSYREVDGALRCVDLAEDAPLTDGAPR